METLSCMKLKNFPFMASRVVPFHLSRFLSQKCDKCPKIRILKSVCEDMASKQDKVIPWQSMWDANCKMGPCPMPEPFDANHYTPSNKLTKHYQQTWNECPPRKLTEKTLCISPQYDYLEPERRKVRDKLVEKPKEKCARTKACNLKDAKPTKCTKIVLPGCRSVRNPPDCTKVTMASDCEKIECPELCYTECEKLKKLNKNKYPKECGCLHVRSITEVYCKLWAKGIFVCPKGKYC